ncbi:MAG: response regulator transcription factor [Roseburia sp.]|nr:response regulator transcription factor [Roseburia sp.]MCM1099336.1 response regulator transcription factor [Ruminococcus flavefaciens]MCM1235611.1 response regulator transcription factor [Ruminococcus flavefaciens]
MLIKVAVVEDETELYDYYGKLLKAWGKARKIRVSTTFAASAEEYLFHYDGRNLFDIVFLDVCLKNRNGMELAREIRKTDRKVQIVFLTGNKEYVFEGYEIGAVRYLIKPVGESELAKAMDACMEKLESGREDYFPLMYHGENLRISRSDILYVKVEGHYLQMQTVNGVYEWKASLKEMQAKLDPSLTVHKANQNSSGEGGSSHGNTATRFVMANRSVVVNLEFVSKITREECILENGESIPVSRGAYGALNEAFANYFFGDVCKE